MLLLKSNNLLNVLKFVFQINVVEVYNYLVDVLIDKSDTSKGDWMIASYKLFFSLYIYVVIINLKWLKINFAGVLFYFQDKILYINQNLKKIFSILIVSLCIYIPTGHILVKICLVASNH